MKTISIVLNISKCTVTLIEAFLIFTVAGSTVVKHEYTGNGTIKLFLNCKNLDHFTACIENSELNSYIVNNYIEIVDFIS